MSEQFKFKVGDNIQNKDYPSEEYEIARRLYDVDSGSFLYELTDGAVCNATQVDTNFVLKGE